MNDFGFYQKVIENLQQVNEKQTANIQKAADLMVEAIENDRLISVFGGGGHTTLPVGEMFFRAGGLATLARADSFPLWMMEYSPALS